MVLKTKEENRTNAQDKPLRLRVELVHLFPLVVQKLSSLIITEFTKYKSNSLSKCRPRAYQITVTEPCRSAVIKHDIATSIEILHSATASIRMTAAVSYRLQEESFY